MSEDLRALTRSQEPQAVPAAPARESRLRLGLAVAAASIVALTTGLVAMGFEHSSRAISNPHADGRIPLPAAMSANAPTLGGRPSPQGANAHDVAAMVAKLEEKVKTGGVSIDEALMLARSYRALDRESESLSMYRKAQSMAPGDRAIELVLASALLRSGNAADQEEAGRIVDKVLAEDPGRPEALWLQALGLVRRHDIPRAREILTKLDELVGENAAAKKAVASLLGELAASDSQRAPETKAETAPAGPGDPSAK